MSTLIAATGGYHVVKPPQYVEEYNYASTPSGASFSWIGVVYTFSPTADMTPIEFRKVGSEDLTDQAKGTEQYTTTIEYEIQNTNFLKYGAQAQGGGTQTPDNALTILTSIRLNNTENFIKLLGARHNSVKVAGKVGESHKVTAELFSNDITPASTAANIGGTPNYTSDPGTKPWTFANGGANPVSVSGRAIPTTEVEVTITRNLERIYTLGSTKVQYLPAKNREIKGSATLVWLSNGNYVDLQDFNNQSARWILSSGSSLELGQLNWTKLDSFAVKPDNVIYEKYSFTARSISVSG